MYVHLFKKSNTRSYYTAIARNRYLFFFFNKKKRIVKFELYINTKRNKSIIKQNT